MELLYGHFDLGPSPGEVAEGIFTEIILNYKI